MLTLRAAQAETLWDELLPSEARELPEDLAGIDELLRDPALLRPIAEHWERSARERGRPTIAMETYVRLMVVKQRSGFGPAAAARVSRRRRTLETGRLLRGVSVDHEQASDVDEREPLASAGSRLTALRPASTYGGAAATAPPPHRERGAWDRM